MQGAYLSPATHPNALHFDNPYHLLHHRMHQSIECIQNHWFSIHFAPHTEIEFKQIFCGTLPVPRPMTCKNLHSAIGCAPSLSETLYSRRLPITCDIQMHLISTIPITCYTIECINPSNASKTIDFQYILLPILKSNLSKVSAVHFLSHVRWLMKICILRSDAHQA
jgi:hypothetical protein